MTNMQLKKKRKKKDEQNTNGAQKKREAKTKNKHMVEPLQTSEIMQLIHTHTHSLRQQVT